MSSFLSKLGKVSGASAVVNGVKSVSSSLSGRPQARAVRDAAKIQAESIDRAMGTVRDMHDQSRADLSPFRERGNAAGDMLMSLFQPGGQLTKTYGGDYHADPFSFNPNADPGAQYRIDTANKALERSAAGRGRSMGGNAIRSVAELNQNLASEEYGKAYDRYNTDRAYGLTENSTNRSFFNTDRDSLYNRLFGISGQGLSAAGGLSGVNAQTGAQLSDLITGKGNVQGGSLIGQANAKAGAVQNLLSLVMQGGGLALGAAL